MVLKGKNKNDYVYQVLFETYYPKIYRISYYIIKDENEAKDITQETFIKAFNKIDTLRDKNKFEPWICTIAVNIARSRYNKKKKEIPIEDENKLIAFIDFNNYSLPENILEKKEVFELISNIIDDMDEHYRQVILLFYYGDLSYDEISNILEVKIGTVKSRLSRAKQIIKKELINKYFNEEGEMYGAR